MLENNFHFFHCSAQPVENTTYLMILLLKIHYYCDLQKISRKERKVKIDGRFNKMFTDKGFTTNCKYQSKPKTTQKKKMLKKTKTLPGHVLKCLLNENIPVFSHHGPVCAWSDTKYPPVCLFTTVEVRSPLANHDILLNLIQ